MSQFARIKVQRPQAQQKTSTVLPSRGDLLRPSISSSFDKGLSDNSGQPLDAGTRAFMEPRFGHDFSHVRVHSDAAAASAASCWNARAFTQDHHVHFGDSYEPSSPAGEVLLAHELTHVVQAAAAASNPAQPTNSVDALEREARHVATAFRLGAALPTIRGLARDLAVPLRAGPEDDPGVPTFGNLPGDQPLSGSRLKLQEIDGKWYEILPGREKNRRRAAGWYDFVVQNGEIWAVKAKSPYGHTEAARGKRVEFAGQIRFTSHSGQINEWNQGSGHYRPTKVFAEQVGLPMDKFRSHPDPLQSVQLPVFQLKGEGRPGGSAPSKTPSTVAGETKVPPRIGSVGAAEEHEPTGPRPGMGLGEPEASGPSQPPTEKVVAHEPPLTAAKPAVKPSVTPKISKVPAESEGKSPTTVPPLGGKLPMRNILHGVGLSIGGVLLDILGSRLQSEAERPYRERDYRNIGHEVEAQLMTLEPQLRALRERSMGVIYANVTVVETNRTESDFELSELGGPSSHTYYEDTRFDSVRVSLENIDTLVKIEYESKFPYVIRWTHEYSIYSVPIPFAIEQGSAGLQPGTGAYAASRGLSLSKVDRETHWGSQQERKAFILDYIRYARENRQLRPLYEEAVKAYPTELKE